VSEWSTARVKQCAYSVPSRLIGEWVCVRIFEDRIVVRYAGKEQLVCDGLRGTNLKRIDYRHIIWSLMRKPGGFARYVYREEMFPSIAFRCAYDAIQSPHRGLKGDLEYLRILHLAASTFEADVLGRLLSSTPSGQVSRLPSVGWFRSAEYACVGYPSLLSGDPGTALERRMLMICASWSGLPRP